MAIRAGYMGVNPFYGIEDALAEFGPALEKHGYRLEIARDECPSEYFAEVDSLVRMITPVGTEFDWDLRDPADQHSPFAKNSLFLYLNDMNEITRWMRLQAKDGGMPDCKDGEDALRELCEASIAEDDRQRREAIASALWTAGADVDDREGIPDEAAAVDEFHMFLCDMLGPTASGCACECGFDMEGDAFRAAVNLGRIFTLTREWIDHDLKPDGFGAALVGARTALGNWLEHHKQTFGGELEAARTIKEKFARKYGGMEPCAHEGIIYNDGRGEARVENPEVADVVFVLHENDAKIVKDPVSYFKGELKNELASLNGEMYSYSITDKKGRIVDQCLSFCGPDLGQNGLAQGIRDFLDGISKPKTSKARKQGM